MNPRSRVLTLIRRDKRHLSAGHTSAFTQKITLTLGRSRIYSFFVDLGPWTPRGECPLRRAELLPWGQLSTERKPL